MTTTRSTATTRTITTLKTAAAKKTNDKNNIMNSINNKNINAWFCADRKCQKARLVALIGVVAVALVAIGATCKRLFWGPTFEDCAVQSLNKLKEESLARTMFVWWFLYRTYSFFTFLFEKDEATSKNRLLWPNYDSATSIPINVLVQSYRHVVPSFGCA